MLVTSQSDSRTSFSTLLLKSINPQETDTLLISALGMTADRVIVELLMRAPT
jgi:hypothetical protein